MCGIVGYSHVNPSDHADPVVLADMCGTIIHRGPDDQGIYTHGPTGLAMRRLSIIDLHTGHQPIANETGTVWIVQNGEIYNYQELAQWLLQRGHRLSTSSDTEVIVHLYEELGERCLDRLRGMFAFAIWDQDQSSLFLARDRLGVKPLYYYWDEERLVFGSELKTLLAHPDVDVSINVTAIETFLRYSYIPDPQTIFTRIKKLPPAHSLVLKNGKLSLECYWHGLRPHPAELTELPEPDALARLEQLLEEAVKLRMISDVPVGAFLSGGVDSSLVVALMARQTSRPVRTFSIGFADSVYNELPYARQVAEHVGTDHQELIVEPQNCDVIERLVSHFDEPFGDVSALPMYFLCQMAARSVKVALSGDGGDELFAGYERYAVALQQQQRERLPASVRRACGWVGERMFDGAKGKRFLQNVALSGPDQYRDSMTYIPEALVRRILAPDIVATLTGSFGGDQLSRHFETVGNQPWLAQLQYVDGQSYLPADVMTKVDRMSMAHSLEAREPLLDHHLAEFAVCLPMALRVQHGMGKYLLKRVAERYLPTSIVHRKKQGFGVPLEHWFKGDLREYVQDILFDQQARQRGLFNLNVVKDLIARYESGRSEYAHTIWLLVVLEVWCRLYQPRMAFQEVR